MTISYSLLIFYFPLDFVIPSEVELQDNTSKICINVLIIDDDVIERSNESAVIIFSSDDDSELIFEHNSIQLIILCKLILHVNFLNQYTAAL